MEGEAGTRRTRGRVTLLDVANAAGVSKSTASRILDERMPVSNSAAAQRVREEANRLGYVRDVSAASLRRGFTGMIGVIVPRLTDTVMAMLYEALAKAAARSGRFTIVATTDDMPDASQEAADALIRRGVDGLVLSTAREGDNLADQLLDRGVPFVLALRHDGKSNASTGDDRLGGYLATRHLLDLGHRRVGLITGPEYASSARGRVEGYHQALEEAEVKAVSSLVVPSTFGIQSGEEAAEKMLSQPDRPTAIFAVNDNTAIGALSAIYRAGLSVPKDISLVGYNDIPIVSRLQVPLTTVRVPFDQIADMALQLLNGDSDVRETACEVRVATPSLIPRKSTARLETQPQM